MRMIEQLAAELARSGLYGSVFGESSTLGYAVIGVLAFALGIVFTMFCFRLRRWREDSEKEDGDDRECR
ncbi:MAG: hypothetical protein IK055_09415 [Lachnospiraceae bacterium]|nr:hypothetical protein [Lachnospiraceae bacterium]